jgi:AcrR family transcriptional regulator
MTDESMEEKIINTAIECLEKFGVEGTTNRVIAAAAGINSAAINYYFRSKDVLIQKAMERTMDHAFDWSDFADAPDLTVRERCYNIFDHLVEGGLNFPGITRAHFHDLLSSGNYDAMVVKRLNRFSTQLCDDLLAHGYRGSRADLEMACMQILNLVFMTVLVPHLYHESLDVDLAVPETRIRYVHTLIDKLL